MDQQKLRSLVLEKTGIKIDLNDPAFALVVMNEAILDEAVARHLGVLEQASRALLAHPALQTATTGAAGKARHDDIWEDGVKGQAAVAPEQAGAAPPQAIPMPEQQAIPMPEQQAMPLPGSAPALSAPPRTLPLPGAAASPAAGSLPWPQMAISAVLAALFTLAGQALFLHPPPPAALSAQQQKQLQDAEKWQKVLPQLDAKTRQQVEEALRKM